MIAQTNGRFGPTAMLPIPPLKGADGFISVFIQLLTPKRLLTAIGSHQNTVNSEIRSQERSLWDLATRVKPPLTGNQPRNEVKKQSATNRKRLRLQEYTDLSARI
jgi:hypothetical protein